MKVQIILLAGTLLGVAGWSFAQDKEVEDPYAIKFVEGAVQMGTRGMTNGKVQTHLAGLGDAVAIPLLKSFQKGDLTNRKKMTAVLQVVRAAFGKPASLRILVDRQPTMTLFFLQSLRRDSADPQVTKEIDHTIAFITEKTKNAGTP